MLKAWRSHIQAGDVSRRWWIAGIVIATICAYIPAMRGGWIWDDNEYVTANIQLHTLHGLEEIWLRPGAVPQYYPLTHSTFWIEYHLWGTHPLGYHIDNVLLHIANAILVGLILSGLGLPGAWVAAGIFAVHPIHVESVAWVTERKNVLSGFLYLSATWIALGLWQIEEAGGKKSDFSIGRYLCCLSLFVMSLMSKSVTASWPAVILLLIWRRRGRISRRELVSLLPFFLLGAASGSLTAWMEKKVVGAVGRDWNFTVVQRLLIAGRVVWFYLWKLIWPHPLTFMYHKWTIDPHALWQWIFPMAACALLCGLWLARHRIGRWPVTASLFFIGSLFPALGFVNVYPMRYSFVADHFVYLASIGPIAAAGVLLVYFSRKWPISLGGAGILLALAGLTWRQGYLYADPQTLWTDVVARDDQSLIGHCNLGLAFYNKGDIVDAERETRKTVELDDDFVEGWMGLGAIAEAKNDLAGARRDYEKARSVGPDNPLPYFNLGLLDRRRGNFDAAKTEFAQAAKYVPNSAGVLQQLGEMELTRGNYPQAIEEFNLAVNADPDLAAAHNDLAAVYLTKGQNDLALVQCRAALAINPDDLTANINMGTVLVRHGQLESAAGYFANAVHINPDSVMARKNLALVQEMLRSEADARLSH